MPDTIKNRRNQNPKYSNAVWYSNNGKCCVM